MCARSSIPHLKQKPEESGLDFTVRLCERLAPFRREFSNDEAFDILFHGLSDEWKTRNGELWFGMVPLRTGTLKDVLKLLRNKGEYRSTDSHGGRYRRSVSSSSSPTSFSSSNSSSSSSSSSSTPTTLLFEPKPSIPMTPTGDSKRYSQIKCFKCKKRGHIARNCRSTVSSIKDLGSTRSLKVYVYLFLSGGKEVRFELDSGTDNHFIPKQLADDIDDEPYNGSWHF